MILILLYSRVHKNKTAQYHFIVSTHMKSISYMHIHFMYVFDGFQKRDAFIIYELRKSWKTFDVADARTTTISNHATNSCIHYTK